MSHPATLPAWRIGGGRLPGVSLLLSLPAVILALVPSFAEQCGLDRVAVAAGEVWRLVTCHWTHWSADHLFWDLAAFLGLAAAVELHPAGGRKRLLAAVALATVAIPVALWVAVPEMGRYRGLSGLDSALFVLLAIAVIRADHAARRRRGALLGSTALGLFLLKVGWETATGGALFAAAGTFVPEPLAHLVGGLCGLAAAWLHQLPLAPAAAAQSAPRRDNATATQSLGASSSPPLRRATVFMANLPRRSEGRIAPTR